MEPFPSLWPLWLAAFLALFAGESLNRLSKEADDRLRRRAKIAAINPRAREAASTMISMRSVPDKRVLWQDRSSGLPHKPSLPAESTLCNYETNLAQSHQLTYASNERNVSWCLSIFYFIIFAVTCVSGLKYI